jgi:putative glutamine amidotransferase
VPNTLAIPEQPNLLEAWFEAISPAAILLSGGNDIGQYAMRDDTEHYLLDRASDRSLPVLGICRGLQMMAVWAGVELQAIEGHVATRHSLVLPDSESRSEWPQTVNSFHGWSLPATPEGFEVAALADDGSIEAIRHRKLPWEGWMWHPERETEFAPQDTRRMRKLFGG